MPTNKQRREAAQRHLQRQLERRAELARRRRRNLGIVLAAVAVVVVVGAGLLIAGIFSDDDRTTASGTTTCTYVADDPTQNPDLTQVDLPPSQQPDIGTRKVTMTTNAGDIGITLDQKNAPCAAGALAHLAEKGFFDGTGCHRLTNSPNLQVLQCGDPSGTGRGGASFHYPTAAKDDDTYPRGTVAMANAGPDPLTNKSDDGSQFFLVYGDSLEGNPNYTVVGTIDEAGLSVLDAIAAKGIQGGAADGAPAEPVTITSMNVAS